MQWTHLCWIVAVFVAALAVAACAPIQSPVTPPAGDAQSPASDELPPAVEYNLGDAVLIQDRFPADSRFREMPVRLNGVIAAPTTDKPAPVVLILHGTHPGCPETEHGVDRWPCDPEVERANYRGFGYLVSELAAQGYVALAINTNAEDTFGFGEGVPGERLEQLITLHLDALATATAGGVNDFGVELAGRADISKLAIFGHSRGAERAVALARKWATDGETRSYGPAAGVLLIAPATNAVDPAGGAPVPMALLNAACDGDVIDQTGQIFFEAARLAPEQRAWAIAVWLERANHNHFNDTLPSDPFGTPGRTDCDPLIDADAQRAFLVNYAGDFLTMIFSPDPARVRAALERMGGDVASLATDELYNAAAQAAWLAEARHRLPLLTPDSEEAFTASPVGGAVTAEGVATLFCPDGYYTPFSNPELADCHRAQVTVPGQPAHAVISWDAPGGALRFELPVGVDNLLLYDAFSVRTGVDPLSPLNPAGASQAFSVQVTDRSGASAGVAVRADEPALRYPAGETEPDDTFGALFTGRLPLLPVRVPIGAFKGVNLASIAEVALVFDQTDSGALFVADVELVRAPVSPRPTLSDPPSAELIAAAEAGDVEAMRQLANLYRPTDALGVRYGNLEQAVFWYRQACAAGYAPAQFDFYDFARTHAELHSDEFLDEALVCLEDAIRQGHRNAIISGAFHAAFIAHDYKTGFFLYALFEGTEPHFAEQRWSFADQLTQAEIDEAERAAAAWRAENQIRDDQYFFAKVNSPFRPVTPAPQTAPTEAPTEVATEAPTEAPTEEPAAVPTETVTPTEAPAEEVAAAAPSSLEDVTWQVTGYRNQQGKPAAPEGKAILTFQNGQLTGNGGCNGFFAGYNVDGAQLTIELGGATVMACDEITMAREEAILANLDEVASYVVENGQLSLFNADGVLLLSLTAQVAPTLDGVVWQATNINNGKEAVVGLIEGTEITAVFAGGGSLSGSAGCNN